MSFPLPPRPPRDSRGRAVEDLVAVQTVFGQLNTALSSTLPYLLSRVAAKVDNARQKYGS